MLSRRFVALMLAALPFSGPALTEPAGSIEMLDTDNDGTLDLAEAKKAASALFTRLDRDHDGTVDKRELAGRLSAKEFGAADPDHDGRRAQDVEARLPARRCA